MFTCCRCVYECVCVCVCVFGVKKCNVIQSLFLDPAHVQPALGGRESGGGGGCDPMSSAIILHKCFQPLSTHNDGFSAVLDVSACTCV